MDAMTVTITKDAYRQFKELAQLNEKQQRLLAGMFADLIGHGGVQAAAEVCKRARGTVSTGRAEFTGKKETVPDRIRRKGGGDKPLIVKQSGLREALKKLLDNNSYGNPERVIFWTTLDVRDIADKLREQGYKVSRTSVCRLIRELGYSLQQNQKMLQVGLPHPKRGEQFDTINSLVAEALANGVPVISVDCKKKELLGYFKNNGGEYRLQGDPRECYDHDFVLKELGKVAPYGVYVLNDNTGFINLTKCSDTSEFAVESIRFWWKLEGMAKFPGAKKLLITCDGGGSNGSRCHLWKEQLAVFAEEYDLEITVCHFPPGTSKWNKIEHRLFCHISHNWAGKPLTSIEAMMQYISHTTTRSGLKVSCRIDPRQYQKGVKVSDERMQSIDIAHFSDLPQWNYTIRGFKKAA